ncbi:MAG: hypothetical protein Fur0037_10370 [Planctomycetota bacterium]
MSHKPIALLAGSLVLLGCCAYLLSGLWSGEEEAILRWSRADELRINEPPAVEDAAAADPADPFERQSVPMDQAAEPDARVAAELHGRVVTKNGRPVPRAAVALEFRFGRGPRGGPPRRVPDAVRTDDAGRFAFAGEVFGDTRLVLRVVHADHAPAFFDRVIGGIDEGRRVDLGDFVVTDGGEVIGRVTDLAGNSVPGATVRLEAQGRDRWRWIRDRDETLPEVRVDQNGYYLIRHVAEGTWSLVAKALHHQEGKSTGVVVEEDRRAEVPDIRLGPGFSVDGRVLDPFGRPIASASVLLKELKGHRSFGALTDASGAFSVDHLPGVAMVLSVDADNYLHYEQADVDPTLGRPLLINLQEGLRITGLVTDARTGRPVEEFGVEAERLRRLPRGDDLSPEEAMARMEAVARKMRDGELADVEVRQVQAKIHDLSAAIRGADRGGFRGRRGPFPGMLPPRGRIQRRRHEQGRFAIEGLQEGIYRVAIDSADHSIWQSAEIELRIGTAPELVAVLDPGFAISGTVVTRSGEPIPGAEVELRPFGDPMQDPREHGGRGGFRMRWPGPALLNAETDVAGRFVLEHAPKGRFVIGARARGHDRSETEPFDLAADRTGIVLALEALGGIEGTVATPRGENGGIAVVAIPAAGKPMFRGNSMTEARPDGSYRIEGLPAGEYAVRATLRDGGIGELWRMIGQSTRAGGLAADVVVKPGEISRFDPNLEIPAIGEVRGLVTWNGSPGKGLVVSLRQEGGDREWMGRRQEAVADERGEFALSRVPAGSYTVAVAMGGRRSGATLLSEPMTLAAREVRDLSLHVLTGSVKGRVVSKGAIIEDMEGSVTFVPGVTELPADLEPFRSAGLLGRERLHAGQFEAEALPPGSWLVVVDSRGGPRMTARIEVAAGQETTVAVQAAPSQGR